MVLKTCLSAFDLELPLNISCCSTISSWRETPFCDQGIKFHGLFILPTSPYSRLNLRNYFLMRKAQLCVKENMSPKHYINRYKQQKWTLWNCCANTFSKTTIAICFNPLQISPSIFKFAERLYFLSSYCYFSLNLVTIPSVWILINFVTPPLIRGMFPFFSLANLDQK